MSEFSYKMLSDVTIPPISGKRPSGGANTETEGVPSLGGENILSGGGVIYEVIKKIPFLFYQAMPKGKLNKFDVLINKDGAQTGKVGLYKGEFDEAAINEHLFIMRPIENTIIDPAYLYYSILLPETQRKIERRITGSAQPGLNSGFVKSVDIPYHGIKKQKKIKNVLETIDQTIEKTESLIHKYQQVKAGLMHDLFTRGLTADGKLRPPREQALELYQETPIGWIPKEWVFELLDRLADRGSGHTPNRNIPGYWNGGVKWISLSDSRRLDKLYISDTDFEISHLGIQNSSAVLQPPGVVVMSRDAGVGKSAITAEPMAVSQHFMCWKCGSKMDNHFLYYWLQFKKRMFENIAMGSTIVTIGLPYFKRLRITAPKKLAEQEEIGKRLKVVDTYIFSMQEELSKLRKQKFGLMHDLLTGEVPCKIGQAETAHV